jgi:hypothetical protein
MTWQVGALNLAHVNYITNGNYYLFKDKILLFYIIKIETYDPTVTIKKILQLTQRLKIESNYKFLKFYKSFWIHKKQFSLPT